MRPRSYALFLVLFLNQALVFSAQALEVKGKVVGLSDGDTLTLLDTHKQRVKIRLAEIDTPESKQPYGNRAKMYSKDARKLVTINHQT